MNCNECLLSYPPYCLAVYLYIFVNVQLHAENACSERLGVDGDLRAGNPGSGCGQCEPAVNTFQ